ncbi:MAG: restriction endonuclease subunit S, partial [Proteobacteria bacterium]
MRIIKKYVGLENLVDYIIDNRGKTVPTSDNGIPLIATNCIKHSSIYPTFENIRYVSPEVYNSWFRAHLKPNDILFVNKGTPGRVCVVPNPVEFCAAQDMVGLRFKDIVDYRYMLAVLRSDEIQKTIANNHVGLVIPHFRKQELVKLKLPVVDRNLQRQIGKLYFDISNKIEINNRVNSELESMAKALYNYWFLQFDFPNENGRPYKSAGGKMEYNENLRRQIPEGWEMKAIDFYADIIDPHPSHRAPTEVVDGFPFAGIGDINEWGNIDLNKARVINEEFVLKQERDYSINEHSIGYGRVGTVGKVVKLRKQKFRYALSPTMAIINPKEGGFPSFVYFTVKNPIFLEWVKKYTSGSTRPAIGIQHLRVIPVIKPKTYK